MNPKIAFGTYRISDLNPEHVRALCDAIEAGVGLIDTSTNYMDGGAERAVAKAFDTLDADLTCKVEIVSKCGYIQGTTLQRIEQGECFDDIVDFSDHVRHCIHPDFIKDQLLESLSRLHVKYIPTYLLHNPEYAFMDAMNRGKSREEALDLMFERIFNAFVTLETLVKEGMIGGYGISSNSFSKAVNDAEFLPYEDLLIFANNAAQEAGSETHHLTTLQLPINLLEREGLKCAAWAKKNGLRVLANRPLNAQKENLMFRLADYEEPGDYFYHYNELLEQLDHESTRTVYNLIEQLDANRHRFGWIGEYESFLYTQIIPHLQDALSRFDATSAEALEQSLQLFLEQYAKMVAYECSKSTRSSLKTYFETCDTAMQQCALEYLTAQESIDYVLLGMRQSRYVADVMNMS